MQAAAWFPAQLITSATGCRLVVGQETPDFELSLCRATIQFAEKEDGSLQDQTTYSDLLYNDTPGETLLQLLEEGGFVDSAKWWTALENCHEKLHGGRIDRFYRKELCDSQYLGGRLSTE